MVVYDLNLRRTRGGPAKAHTELLVDTDAVLPGSVTLERLQAVARRHAKIIQPPRDLELPELAARDGLDAREAPDPLTIRERFRVCVSKRYDHAAIVTPRVITVKEDAGGALTQRGNPVKQAEDQERAGRRTAR